MRKKKMFIATPDGSLVEGNARQSTLTLTQDGITIEAAQPTFRVTSDGRSVENYYYSLSKEEQRQIRQFYGMEDIPTEIYADTIIKPSSKKDDTPKEFHPLLCTRCGGNLAFKNEFLVCEYCGTMYSSDLSVSEKSQECYEPENKCVTCGRSIHASTLDNSKPVYICGSMNGCSYEEGYS